MFSTWDETDDYRVWLEFVHSDPSLVFLHLEIKTPFTVRIARELYEKLPVLEQDQRDAGRQYIFAYTKEDTPKFKKFVQMFGWEPAVRLPTPDEHYLYVREL